MAAGTHVIVAGGGAAGVFAAITCAEALGPADRVTIYEATANPLAKVRVSGGGRCNVTHACFDPGELVKHYPRGGRELRGPFHRWQPRDMCTWLAVRGVETKTESDGRMFPRTDDSATIVDCLLREAEKAGVRLVLRTGVRRVTVAGVSHEGGDSAETDVRFQLELTDGSTAGCARLLVATGGGRSSPGFTIAEKLGHTIEPPVPSLFTFHVDDARLAGLAGVSVRTTGLGVPGTKLKAEGPLLVTHTGLSGPAILKLSAWGARELAARGYAFPLKINLVASHTTESLRHELMAVRTGHPRKQIATWCPLALPQRLWERMVAAAGIAPAMSWTGLGNTALAALARAITDATFDVTGQSRFKEEFVTCGGVRLKEVNFRTMESRIQPGLHFAGEVLDVDGVTGGFNFQSAWTTGRLAGLAMAGGDSSARR